MSIAGVEMEQFQLRFCEKVAGKHNQNHSESNSGFGGPGWPPVGRFVGEWVSQTNGWTKP